MAEKRKVSPEELEREEAEQLPDREALSLLDAGGGLVGGGLIDPLASGGLPLDPTAGDQMPLMPIDDGATDASGTPAASLTDAAGAVAGTAADAAASDADSDTTIGEDGEYSNSDTAVSET